MSGPKDAVAAEPTHPESPVPPRQNPPPLPSAARGDLAKEDLDELRTLPAEAVARPVPKRRPQAKLVVVRGPDRGEEFPLEDDSLTLGRALDNQFVLADISVSRRHVALECREGLFRVRDLGSGNGTLVNGNEVAEAPLDHGDLVELGKSLLRFELALGPRLAPFEEVESEGDAPDALAPMLEPSLSPVLAPNAKVDVPESRLDSSDGWFEMSRRRLTVIAVAGAAAAFVASFFLSGVAGEASLGKAESSFDAALIAVQKSQWEDAREGLLRANLLCPKSEGIRVWLERAEQEIRGRDLMAEVWRAIERNDTASARSRLLLVSAMAGVRADVPALLREIERRRVEAEASVVKKIVPDPGEPQGGAAAVPTPPIAAGDRTKDAQDAYLKKDFAAAEKMASPAHGGEIRAIAKNVAKLEALERRGNFREAERLLRDITRRDRALTLSRGQLARELKAHLWRLTRAEARTDFEAGRFEKAYATAEIAIHLGGRGDLEARRVLAQLEDKAALFLEQAKALSPPKSKALLTRVLKIVPRSSPLFGKAKALLLTL